jgi:hypothetical protein
VSDDISESSSLPEGVWARKCTVGGFVVAEGGFTNEFGVSEYRLRLGVVGRGFRVAERTVDGMTELIPEGEIGRSGSVSWAASL